MAFCSDFMKKIRDENPCLWISILYLITALGFLLMIGLVIFLTILASKYAGMCKGNEKCALGLALSSVFAVFAIFVISLFILKALHYRNERMNRV
jgi:hypothetical protein